MEIEEIMKEKIDLWNSLVEASIKAKLTKEDLFLIYPEVCKDIRVAQMKFERQAAPTILATDKQKTLMEQLKIIYTDETTKSEASKLISEKLGLKG